MKRTYTFKLSRDDRVGALFRAQLYRVSDDGGLMLVAEVDDNHDALGIGEVLSAFSDQLIAYQDAHHGQLP